MNTSQKSHFFISEISKFLKKERERERKSTREEKNTSKIRDRLERPLTGRFADLRVYSIVRGENLGVCGRRATAKAFARDVLEHLFNSVLKQFLKTNLRGRFLPTFLASAASLACGSRIKHWSMTHHFIIV